MNPVVGLDVAKGESQIQGFLDKKKPYKASFKVPHTLEGLDKLRHFLIDIENNTGVRPPVVLDYDKKRDEGKPYKVAIIACANKLLHWIYALLKSNTTFQDIA
nr:hypothetical protein [Paucisalibacillus globulus]